MSEQQGSNAGTGGQGDGGQNAGGNKTFTQSEVNEMIARRAEQMMRSRLGGVDPDDLRRKAEKYDELEAANKSELEKANARAEEAEKRATTAETRIKDLSLSTAIRDAASKAGFIDAGDASALIDRSNIEFDGDEPKNLDKLLGALAKAKPHLVKEGGEPAPTTGSGDGGPQGSTTTTKNPGDIFGDYVAAKLGQ